MTRTKMRDETRPPAQNTPALDDSTPPTSVIQVIKSNKLIEGQARLTTRQQKLLAACIALVNPQGDYPNGITVELTDDQIQALTGIPKRTIVTFIDDAAKAYHSIPIETPGKKKGAPDYINIALRSWYDPDERVLRMTFHPKMEAELLNLPEYTRYALQYLVRLDSKYAIRLFELISKVWNKKRPGPQYWRVSLRDLYYPLGLIDIHGKPVVKSYTKSVSEFRRRVLDPAIKQINEHTMFTLTAQPYRRGRAIGGMSFTIDQKEFAAQRQPALDASDDPQQALQAALVDAGVAANVAGVIVNRYDLKVVQDNLQYMKRQIEGGMMVRSPGALLNTLLAYNVANLPDVANPYSEMYRGNKHAREFVKRVGMKVWWKLPSALREEIEALGGFTQHPVTMPDYLMFEDTAQTGSYDEAALCLNLEEIPDLWEYQYKKEMRDNEDLPLTENGEGETYDMLDLIAGQDESE